jgi:CBS domain containing-hemolysin-like protein
MVDSLIAVGIIAGLIALNGLFVAAEFAVVGVSRAEIERGVREGRPTARLMSWVIDSPVRQDRFIATAQLGITVASLGLGMYGEHVLAAWIASHLEAWGADRWIAAHTVASVVSVSILTYFHIVVGEMVPKSLALQYARPTLTWVAPLMLVLQHLLYPVIVALNGIGNGILKVFGVRREAGGSEHYRTPEEIRYIVRESQEGGLLRKGPAQLLGDLIEFGDLTAAEVMVPRVRVVGVPMNADASTLREILRAAPHTRYPVYERSLDNIVGTLHVRDALRGIRAGSVMGPGYVRTVPHVPRTAPVDEVLAAMRKAAVQMVVVMSEHGGTAGIVTLEDLFEEVVGDLSERPGDVAEIAPLEGGGVRADGMVRIDELGEALSVVLEHDEVDTVSGLVLDLLGRPPVVGDVVFYRSVRIEVSAVQGTGVRTVIARRQEREPKAAKPREAS